MGKGGRKHLSQKVKFLLYQNDGALVLSHVYLFKGMVSKLLEPYGRLENDPLIYRHFSEDWEYSVSRKIGHRKSRILNSVNQPFSITQA